MNSTAKALVKAFIERIAYGTALDDCGNRDDDSANSMGDRVMGLSPYHGSKLNQIGQNAKRLLPLLSDEQKPGKVEYWQAKFLGATERFGARVKFECQTRPGYFMRPYDHKVGDSIEKQAVAAYKVGDWEFEFLYTDVKGIAHYRITREA